MYHTCSSSVWQDTHARMCKPGLAETSGALLIRDRLHRVPNQRSNGDFRSMAAAARWSTRIVTGSQVGYACINSASNQVIALDFSSPLLRCPRVLPACSLRVAVNNVGIGYKQRGLQHGACRNYSQTLWLGSVLR